MSTAETMAANAAAIIKQFSGADAPLTDLDATVRAVEGVKTVKFAWHPWLPLANLGADGFRFNVPYAVLERLQPIALPVFPYAQIKPRSAAQPFSLASVNGAGQGIPAASVGSQIEQALQYPSESGEYLLIAYKQFGMVMLESLTAHGEEELQQSYVLYAAALSGAPELTLEEFPEYLTSAAPELLERAQAQGVEINGAKFSLGAGAQKRGEELLTEIGAGIAQAHDRALNGNDGILPTTKKLLNIAANGGTNGKTHLDNLDVWLLKQFPSFRMDTDVERAQQALMSGLQQGAQAGADTNAALMALVQQNQQMLQLLMAERQQQTPPQKAGKAGASPQPPPAANQ